MQYYSSRHKQRVRKLNFRAYTGLIALVGLLYLLMCLVHN